MGITIVLSHSHCTIESYLLLITPSPHPPSLSSLALCFIRPDAPTLLLSGRGGRRRSLLLIRLEAVWSGADVSGQPVCQ